MEFDLIWLALGIAAAGFFIGYGLINFNNPNAKSFSEIFEEEEHELITENDVHDFMGISKEDAKYLIKEHPDVPHIVINNKVYYPRAKLREWLENPGE
ncbi:helix-turn-helix domain-containing protein [Paraliobacillus sediminis]|uniref:helix-turn-helix domain-containing protein n=1 Tax=Paraliobacillus sediminis TaxID=1885916 RepID=UPI000E3BEF94|nr:helix-turn-helix domain-containing protein [Paraliobacillus sediminis]